MKSLKAIDREIRYLQKVLAQGGIWQKSLNPNAPIKRVEVTSVVVNMEFKRLDMLAELRLQNKLRRLRKLSGRPLYFAHQFISNADKKYWANTGPAQRAVDEDGNLIYVTLENETTV